MRPYQVTLPSGHKSVGYSILRDNPENMIYQFRIAGKTYWSGDLVTLRTNREDAFRDLKGLGHSSGATS